MRSIVHSRQSIMDIAIQECGSFEAAFAVAERNGLAVTDDLTVGQSVEFAPEDISKKHVAASLAAQGVKPATAISEVDAALVPWGGIGFMGIEIDFIVS